jgi:hypothetical protein
MIDNNSFGDGPEEFDRFRKVSRAHVLGLLKKATMIIIPDLPSVNMSSLSLNGNGAYHAFTVATAAIHSTLAPTMNSPELIPFRELAEKLKHTARSRESIGDVMNRSMSKLSLPTISQLSQTFNQSLRIE